MAPPTLTALTVTTISTLSPMLNAPPVQTEAISTFAVPPEAINAAFPGARSLSKPTYCKPLAEVPLHSILTWLRLSLDADGELLWMVKDKIRCR